MYPEGSLYYYIGGYLSRVQGNIDQALERFSLSYEINDQFFEMENICKYEIGWCHYLKNEYENARMLFEEFLENHTSPAYKAWWYWQLGYCCYFMGNESQARGYMSMVKQYKRKHYSWDEYWYRKSKEYMTEVSDVEMQLHKLYNCVKWRKLEFPKDLQEQVDNSNSPDLSAYAIYLRAKIEFYKDNRAEAREYYNQIIDMAYDIKNEKYLIPFSKYRLLLLKIKDMENDGDDSHVVSKDDLEYVKTIVKEISKMSGYDFEKPLVRKLERVKDYFKQTHNMKF
jgi:tetratricopeptide (TPR) repeat protein